MRMRLLTAGVVLLLICAVAPAQREIDNPESVAIARVLESQVQAWNAHNLEGFMAGYWKSPELSFFSGATQTYGWEQTLARYKTRYQSAGAEMGTLDFSAINVQRLSPDAAFVRGQFHLKMSSGKESSGIFTLIFRKFPEGWRIIHDHTSS